MPAHSCRFHFSSGALALACFLALPAGAATLTVLTDAATGPGSLRQALLDAAAVPSGTTAEIVFDPVFFEVPRTVVLDAPLPVVKRSLVIDGPVLAASGEPMVTVSGDFNGSGTIDQGDVAGLHLEVPAEGAATVRRVAFSGCRSTANPGGAVFFRPAGPAVLLIEHCVFTGNAGRWGGAVSMGGDGHQATVRDCVFAGNQASEHDGGAMHLGSTPALVERCIFRNNTAPGGGAIHTFHGGAVLRGCLFETNTARTIGQGGAVSARLGLKVIDCTFVGNRARAGGALFLSEMLPPATGAAIENSTFSANVATGAPGGAIYAIGTEAQLRHCTITLNHANADAVADPFAGGGGIAVPGAANENRIRLHNCVVAENQLSGPGSAAATDLQAPATSVISLGGNVIGIGDSLATVFSQPGDASGSVGQPLAAMLAALAANGGPLATHLPAPASPVIDIGVPGPNPVIDVDQRGRPRPGGAGPDAGAVERVSPGDD